MAEGYHSHLFGDDVSLCQVILYIDQLGHVVVLRGLPFQKADADVPRATVWSPIGIADADGDGHPDIILRADGYEDHWLEVLTVNHGSAQLTFSGLGNYL